MAGGLFELRRDDITGWWVAVVVDREFERHRFQRPAGLTGIDADRCPNCRIPSGGGVRVRELKPLAFSIAGDSRQTARSAISAMPLRATIADISDPDLGLVGDCGSWQTIVAPPGHHMSLAEASPGVVIQMLARARDAITSARSRDQTEYLQVVQNWGTQAGARTDHLCLDFYDLPQIPHRIGEELGGAARYLIREGVCPYCRLVREEVVDGARLVFQDAASVCFAPYASRSPFELWVVPRHHDADFARATDEQLTSAGQTLQRMLGMLGVLDGPPYNLVLHTAPLRERVDDTYHWHWEIHPRLREIAGLELGTGLPVNPVSPEEAVGELLEAAGTGSGGAPSADASSSATGARDWDAFLREAAG